MIAPELKEWATHGHYFELLPFNLKIFYKEYGRADAKAEDTLLLLHGFPESSFSYHKIVKGMEKLFKRIILFDLPGYGLSDKPTEDYTYSLFEQADAALHIWRHLGVKGGHLLSHDMGDSVVTELAARHVGQLIPSWFSAGFQSFTFTNGSMVLDLAELRITQKILLSKYGRFMSNLSTYKLFSQQVRSAHGNDNLSENDLALLWNNVIQQDGHRKNHLIIKYLNDRKRFEKTRWLPALSMLELPIHICWGEDDAVARVEMAHYLKDNICPTATLTLMPGVGHFCQLGSPGKWVDSVGGFYMNKIG